MTLAPKVWVWEEWEADPHWFQSYSTDQLMVWQATLPETSETEARLVTHLSSAERLRLASYHQRGDQQRFLAGRGLLRLLLSAHLGADAGCVHLACGPHGKPFLVARAGLPGLHFNVSHSGKWVLLAFSSSHEVGVDIEEVQPHDDLASLARQVFAAGEFADWLHWDADGKLAAFYKKWTRHEASLKATGSGFTGESKSETKTTLNFFELALPAGYEGAVATVS